VEDFSVGILGSVWSLILVDFVESEAGGTGLLGVLGMGARISLWYPGARKLDRLLLASWEVSRFGQSWSVHQEAAKQQAGQLGQWRN
jgi:hypothetical protein